MEALLHESDVSPSVSDNGNSFSRFAPLLVVGVVVAFNLVELRAEATSVAYLNDSSLHNQMARFAASRIGSGHFPLDSWFPFLSLGSPQYMHYQSLGSMVVGLIGYVINAPNTAFAWSIYLLISLWPLCIYACSRLFGFDKWQAASAAVLSTFIASATGVGYEQASYLFIGFGIWTQLCAMWVLPFAWAFSWRAVARNEHLFLATLFTALTVALHYLTGYLALIAIVVWAFLSTEQLLRRIGRAVLVFGSSLLASAWVIVPLFHYEKWAALNESLLNTVDTNSYGARRVLSWLFTGDIYDAGRLPIITVLVGAGIVACLTRYRHVEAARALLAMWAVSLLLFFGRPTWGFFIDLLPAHQDLYLRRFIVGTQLAGVLLAGVGTMWLAGHARVLLLRWLPRAEIAWRAKTATYARRALGALLCGVALAPAWTQLRASDSDDRSYIVYQKAEDATEGAQVNALIAIAQGLGDGRMYAGLPQNWGSNFTVGSVPVFKYLESQDVDEVGYTLRTQSLMTNPEENFNELDPSDFVLFGVRYLLLPAGHQPPVPAKLIAQRGTYQLWMIAQSSYFQVIETTTPLTLNRGDIGSGTLGLLGSSLPANGIYPTVAYAGAPAAPSTLTSSTASSSPGTVVSQSVQLTNGTGKALVKLDKPAVVLFKVSYDPGWTVSVDGKSTPTEMIAPALVGVAVPSGQHTVVFTYRGYSGYGVLLGIAGVTLLLLALSDLRRRKRWFTS